MRYNSSDTINKYYDFKIHGGMIIGIVAGAIVLIGIVVEIWKHLVYLRGLSISL